MSLTMPKNQPAKEEPEESGKRSGENLNVWVRGDIADALRAYLASVRPRTTKTASVEQALEDFLASKGFPPQRPEDA